MSMTLANLQYAVLSRVAPDESNPAYTAIHADNITRWANEKTSEVILALEPEHLRSLITISSALTFSASGADAKVALPSTYIKDVSLKVSIDSVLKPCYIYKDPNGYNRWDSSSFIWTPSDNKPVAKIMDNYIWVKPNDVTSGYLEYIRQHPTLSGSQGTLFDSVGDDLLIKLVSEEAMKILEMAVD